MPDHFCHDFTGKAILDRKAVLERILKPSTSIPLGSYVEVEGTALFNLTKEKGMVCPALLPFIPGHWNYGLP
jgi:hypothetical protein